MEVSTNGYCINKILRKHPSLFKHPRPVWWSHGLHSYKHCVQMGPPCNCSHSWPVKFISFHFLLTHDPLTYVYYWVHVGQSDAAAKYIDQAGEPLSKERLCLSTTERSSYIASLPGTPTNEAGLVPRHWSSLQDVPRHNVQCACTFPVSISSFRPTSISSFSICPLMIYVYEGS